MLEAQAILAASPDGVGQQGDVLVAALPGHPWGDQDRRKLLVVKWNDPVLEQQLVDRRKAGEDWPVIAYPYAIMADARTMKRLSSKTIDLSRNPALLDDSVEKPILEPTDYALIASGGFLGTVVQMVKDIWNRLVA